VPKSTTRPPAVDALVSIAPSPDRRKVRFRVYCFACGRATEVDVAPRRMNRCDVCGGTMLVELGASD
jgi:hypothetical protein